MQQQLERSLVTPHCLLSERHHYSGILSSALHRPIMPADDLVALMQQAAPRTEVPHSDPFPEKPLTGIISAESYWNAAHFGLDRVAIFQDASFDEQQAILALASLNLLQEAYCIEKAGMGYMSRMALLAESVQERMIYTLFAADETSHFVQLCPYLSVEPTVIGNPFLHMLSEVVEGDDKTVLLFVIQVVLEGWGLSHYRALAKDCTHDLLRQTLQGFLADESRHHATGVTLFNQAQLSSESHAAIVEILAQFFYLVQVGPQGVLEAIAHVKGHLSRTQKLQVLEELDTEHHSGSRLQLLRSLMRGDGAGAIIQALEERDAFRPFNAHEAHQATENGL